MKRIGILMASLALTAIAATPPALHAQARSAQPSAQIKVFEGVG